MKPGDERFPVIVMFFLLLSLPVLFHDPEAGDAAPEDKAREGEFSVFGSPPVPVSHLVGSREYLEDVFVLSGTRPEGDRPRQAVKLLGQRRSGNDWVLEDGAAAVWVTGLPAPEAGRKVVLAAKSGEGEGGFPLAGLRLELLAESTLAVD